MTNRIFRFDTAKTVLMVCVVFCHAVTFCPGPLSVKEFARFSILGCAMPAFMFVSGWFSKAKPSTRSIIQLCTLFVICNTVGNLVWSLSNGVPFRLFRLAVVMWYLLALIVYRLAMPVVSKVPCAILAIGAFVLSWLAAFHPVDFGFPFLGRLVAFFPFFILGYVVSREQGLHRVRDWLLGNESPRNWSIGCLVALILILATGACFSLCRIQPGFITRNVTFSASGGGFRSVQWRIAFQILYLVMGACFLKACPTHETVLSGFGRRTLPVYLFHPYVLVPVAALIANRPELTSWPVRYALMGISALATLFFFHPRVQSLVSGMVSWPKRRIGS